MFMQLENKKYFDPETGVRMGVQESQAADGPWLIWVRAAASVSHTSEVVQGGYASEEEAQGALDELMSETGAVRVQPPITPEEESE